MAKRCVQGKNLMDDLRPEQIKEIERLAKIGCDDNLIADCLGIPTSTFTDSNALRLLTRQKRAQHKAAILDDQDKTRPKQPIMQIWQGKQFLGQSDKQAFTHDISQETATLLGLVDGDNRGKLPVDTDGDTQAEQ